MAGLLFKGRVLLFRRPGGAKKNILLSGGLLSYRRFSGGRSVLMPRRAALGAHHLCGGKGYIAGEAEGIVTVNGSPAARRIYLFVRPHMLCVADTWSAADGSYRFDRLNENMEFLMVATDYKKQYEPVSYDFVKPYVERDG